MFLLGVILVVLPLMVADVNLDSGPLLALLLSKKILGELECLHNSVS